MTALGDAYECECCRLPLCRRKLPGIGYYCGRCEQHFGWFEDLGRPSAKFARFKDFDAAVRAEHARMVDLVVIISQPFDLVAQAAKDEARQLLEGGLRASFRSLQEVAKAPDGETPNHRDT